MQSMEARNSALEQSIYQLKADYTESLQSLQSEKKQIISKTKDFAGQLEHMISNNDIKEQEFASNA
jgi:hypothetical protein